MERFMHEYLGHATLVNHPRFFAYIPCPGSYIGSLGSFLAAATNLFTGSWLGGAVAAQIEVQLLDWIRVALGLPTGFGGVLTSGGSLANLSAIAAARTRLSDDRRAAATVYVGAAAHYSIAKAARLLGVPQARIRTLPSGADQRLRAESVEAILAADRDAGLRPMILCATLGTTTTGAIDPIDALADVALRQDVWLHVDGAYGAAAALLPEFRALAEALARADSITLDPHKWLYSPFESGCFLTRHLDALTAAFTAQGEYMQDIPPDEINMFQRGPELSRGNRALKLWLLLRSVGTDTLIAAIRKDIRLCQLAHDLLQQDPRVEIVSGPQLSMFCFAVGAGPAGEAMGQRLMQDILEDGYLMLSSSRIDGRYVLRFCVLNHRTTDADIRGSVARIRKLLDRTAKDRDEAG
jgi:glutamate/tyrosine decarboxylase-like PLP-dependent enzyme